jgi:ureidoglycolate lyase
MPVWIATPGSEQLLQAEKLEQSTFAQFGTVISNPSPSLIPSQSLTSLPPNAVQANQGSALKYLDVTHMKDLYATAPSTKPSKAVMNMFVCAPRELNRTATSSSSSGTFPVRILERHPYTTQTFIPLGLSPSEVEDARYLVIVAPSSPPSQIDEALPVPPVDDKHPDLPGRGLPDLTRIRAFIADGSQAVTYGAGTWHAPMVVIGSKPISFVVVQFANSVGIEDCQEVEWENGGKGKIEVLVPGIEKSQALATSTKKMLSKL